MSENKSKKNPLSVFFIIGAAFLAIGIANPPFLAIGMAFIAIGLFSMMKDREKGVEPGAEDISGEAEENPEPAVDQPEEMNEQIED